MNKKNEKLAFGRLDQLRNDILNKNKKIKIGFIGGGPNSFIGYTHRLAARFDNKFEMVAGVFSTNISKSIEFGISLGIDKSRCYSDYLSMAKEEAKRKDGIEAVGVMTPAGYHYKISKEFLEKKIHVICDKPITASVDEALKLEKVIKKNKVVFALTHNYSAYPMLREAKKIIDNGNIGKIHLINVEYPQGYTVGLKKKEESNVLKWRLDKKISGESMILQEIGTHAYHLMRFVTSLEAKELSAEISTLSDQLTVDDNAFVVLRMNNNARASIWVSSAATGGENGLKIRVYGNKGAVEWFQDNPNILKFTELNSPTKLITRASEFVSDLSLKSSRVAAGHPEGFFEAFANLYSEFAESIMNYKKGKLKKPIHPTIKDGIFGIQFVSASKKSSKKNGAWIKLKS